MIDLYQVVALHAGGMSVAKIATELGVSASVIYQQCQRRGIVLPRRKKPKPPPKRIKVDDAALRKLHAAGANGKQIASELGVAVSAARLRCKALGLALPKHKPGQVPASVAVNQRYGRLVVQEFAGMHESGQRSWRCLCDCDNEIVVVTGRLRRVNGTQSCGCLCQEVARAKARPIRMPAVKEAAAKHRFVCWLRLRCWSLTEIVSRTGLSMVTVCNVLRKFRV